MSDRSGFPEGNFVFFMPEGFPVEAGLNKDQSRDRPARRYFRRYFRCG